MSNLLTITMPVVNTQTPQIVKTYNARGQVLTSTDETGVVTKYTYDTTTEKLLTKIVDYSASTGHLNLTWSYLYDAMGNVNSATDPNSHTTTFAFNNNRQMTQKTDPTPFSYVTKYGYDLNGNLLTVQRQTGTTPAYQTYTWAYSLTDKKHTLTDPASQVFTWNYDGKDRLKNTIDAQSREYQFAYDAMDRIYQITDPTSVISDTRTYTANGYNYQRTDARSHSTTLSYDGFDRLDKTTYADSSYEENQSYDANDNVLTYRTRSGNTIVNTYDALDRLSTKAPTGEATATYMYDLHGRKLSSSTPVVSGNPATGTFSFAYDTAGRYYKETTPDSKVTLRGLDGVGNVTKLTYPDGYYVTRVFDQLDRLTDIKLNGATSSAIHITYDQLSRRAVLTYGNGATSTYTFQLNDDLTTLAEAFTSSSVSFTYGFNHVHQETSRAVTDNTYLWYPGATGTTTYGTANTVNEYPTIGSASYTYDGNANLKSDGTWTYTYDTENHLLTAAKTGTSASYVYDSDHRQIQKTVGSVKTRYAYDKWQRLSDYDGAAGTLLTRYIYGDSIDEALLTVNNAGTISYQHTDRSGSVIALTNASGTVTNKAVYSPFGEGAPPTGTTCGFTGQRYDAETGNYFYKRRYYSPAIGRFLQPDPVPATNLYAYVSNDPLNNSDPLGAVTLFGTVTDSHIQFPPIPDGWPFGPPSPHDGGEGQGDTTDGDGSTGPGDHDGVHAQDGETGSEDDDGKDENDKGGKGEDDDKGKDDDDIVEPPLDNNGDEDDDPHNIHDIHDRHYGIKHDPGVIQFLEWLFGLDSDGHHPSEN